MCESISSLNPNEIFSNVSHNFIIIITWEEGDKQERMNEENSLYSCHVIHVTPEAVLFSSMPEEGSSVPCSLFLPASHSLVSVAQAAFILCS